MLLIFCFNMYSILLHAPFFFHIHVEKDDGRVTILYTFYITWYYSIEVVAVDILTALIIHFIVYGYRTVIFSIKGWPK